MPCVSRWHKLGESILQFLGNGFGDVSRVGHFQEIHVHHFGFQIPFRPGVTAIKGFEVCHQRRIHNGLQNGNLFFGEFKRVNVKKVVVTD